MSSLYGKLNKSKSPRYIHPITQERISEIQTTIQLLKAELQTVSGKECHVELKDEIAHWRKEIRKLQK